MVDCGTIKEWTPYLSGGLAGSILALVGQRIYAWWSAPELAIDFHEDYRGCRVQTPAQTGNGQEVQQHYIRIKIRNRGRSTAKNVSVVVTGLGLRTGEFEDEVLDLQTSLSSKLTFDVGRRGYRFVDLFHLLQSPAGVAASFDFVQTPWRLQRIAVEPHEFTARIFVSADNAASVSREVVWKWDGGFDGLRIDGSRPARD